MKQDSKPAMSNTVDKHTPGEWEAIKQGGSILAPFMIRSGKICVANLIWGISSILPETYEEVEANAALIASAPQLKKENEELFEMVRQLKNCINRLSQDGLTQHERDIEAQWEGEAHELLTRINPNYYRNANQ